MKVLNLACAHGHVFEGWFGSAQDFTSQCERGLVECPVCGNREVDKRPSAPRLNLGAQPTPTPDSATSAPVPAAPSSAAERPDRAQQARLLQALRQVWSDSEDVGERFAEQARRMHEGEQPAKPIRGQATLEDTMALLEEGVPVLPLPDLPLLKGPLQ